MRNSIFCIIATFALLHVSTAADKVPEPVIPVSATDAQILPAEPEPAKKEVPPPLLTLTLTSVDIAKNLWRENEKGTVFQIHQVSDSSGVIPHPEITPGSEKNDSSTQVTPHHEQPCAHHVQDILIPKGVTSGPASGLVSNPHFLGHQKSSVRRYIKDRAGRSFWPFVDWYYDDPCYYGGPGCYPPPPMYPPPYYPPPPPYY